MAGLAIDLVATDAATLTHGHEMGYIPAAMLVHIVRLVSHSQGITLEEAVWDSVDAIQQLFPRAVHLPEFLEKIQLAVNLAKQGGNDLEAIHALGPGWYGDEALAVAIYCALKYQHDFDKALVAAINHGGDSDSTGAITGNILRAYTWACHGFRKNTPKIWSFWMYLLRSLKICTMAARLMNTPLQKVPGISPGRKICGGHIRKSWTGLRAVPP